jgi:hypothetical protein
MTRRDAFQIARQADEFGELHPTHAIAADMRAANARLRHNARRTADRFALRPMPTAETVDAAFARIFGSN